MKYVPIPVAMLAVGQPLPVDIWSASGQLLLRKGQPVVSEEHRDKLHAHNASSTPADALAWQRSYERMVHELLSQGMDVQQVSRRAHAQRDSGNSLRGCEAAQRRMA